MGCFSFFNPTKSNQLEDLGVIFDHADILYSGRTKILMSLIIPNYLAKC